jgi:hypothetical protein
MTKKGLLGAVLSVMLGCAAFARPTPQPAPQDNKKSDSSASSQPTSQPAPAANSQPAERSNTEAQPAGKAPVSSTKIPSGSKIYVAPMGGFENYVIAGILKKKVPVTIVGDRDKAEYEIRGSQETEKAGWAKMLFMGSQQSNEQASINVQEIKTGNVVFAYSVNKINSVKGKQSAGEAIGKHLKEAIGKD